jgi:hypothetical protein
MRIMFGQGNLAKRLYVHNARRYKMKRLLLMVVVLSVFASSAFAAEFTPYDENSKLHVGASALINGSCNAFGILITGEAVSRQRAYCAVVTAGIGLVKEFALDEYPDYGDIMWNLVGIAITDQAAVYLFPVEGGGGIGFTNKF